MPVVLGDYLISAFERASVDGIMVTCWLPVRKLFCAACAQHIVCVTQKPYMVESRDRQS